MPITPYPITVTLYDTDGTTLKNGANVLIRNVTKKTQLPIEKTDSNGVVIFGLENLPIATGQTNEYDIGDQILIIAFYGNNHEAIKKTVSGGSLTQTLYLGYVPFIMGESNNLLSSDRIVSIVTGNTGSSVYYCKIYAVQDGQLLCHIETPANDTRSVFFGDNGLGGGGGFVIERENKELIVTAKRK